MAHDATLSPRTAFRRLIANLRRSEADRRLEAELRHYHTVADRRELAAILDRHTPEETEPVLAILDRQEIWS